MEKRLAVFAAFMLILSIGSFSRLTGNENIRAIQFVSIFTIGAFSSLLLLGLIQLFRGKRDVSKD